MDNSQKEFLKNKSRNESLGVQVEEFRKDFHKESQMKPVKELQKNFLDEFQRELLKDS